MFSEDDDSTLVPSKKLASLFDKGTNVGGNSSLMYKAPKQPRTPSSTSPSHSSRRPQQKETLNLILLKVVQTFKFENDIYNSQGKLGAAIMGSANTYQYQLILYREKTSHITQAPISLQFWFSVQPKNYASFKDKTNVLWSLLFENSQSLVKFSTEIALARWGCTERHDTILSQDLSVAGTDGKKVEEGNKVEIAYTARLISSANKLDKEIETKETFSLVVSADQGWKSTLIGAVEGSKKLIILPPNQLGQWKNLVTQNSSLALEIDVVTVNASASSLPPTELSSSPEKNVKERGASISEALTNSPLSSRANLISRMARMGQATLPLKGAKIPTISDSDETEEDSSSTHSSDNVKQPEPVKPQKTAPVSYQPLVIPTSAASAPPVFAGQTIMMNQAAVYEGIGQTFTTAATSPGDPQLSVFFSELRTNNTELRMGINRVTDKAERVLDKMDVGSLDKVLQQLQAMEKTMVSQFNVIQNQNLELGSVLKQEGRSSQINQHQPDSINRLQKEHAELVNALSQCASRTKELQDKLEELNMLKSDLHRQLAHERESRDIIKKEHSTVIRQLQIQLQEQESTVKFWEAALQKLSSRVPQLERKIEERQKNCSKENSDIIRKLMTTVYRNLQTRFPQDSTVYKTSDIHTVLGEIIKATTLEYLKPQVASNVSQDKPTLPRRREEKDSSMKQNGHLHKERRELAEREAPRVIAGVESVEHVQPQITDESPKILEPAEPQQPNTVPNSDRRNVEIVFERKKSDNTVAEESGKTGNLDTISTSVGEAGKNNLGASHSAHLETVSFQEENRKPNVSEESDRKGKLDTNSTSVDKDESDTSHHEHLETSVLEEEKSTPNISKENERKGKLDSTSTSVDKEELVSSHPSSAQLETNLQNERGVPINSTEITHNCSDDPELSFPTGKEGLKPFTTVQETDIEPMLHSSVKESNISQSSNLFNTNSSDDIPDWTSQQPPPLLFEDDEDEENDDDWLK